MFAIYFPYTVYICVFDTDTLYVLAFAGEYETL